MDETVNASLTHSSHLSLSLFSLPLSSRAEPVPAPSLLRRALGRGARVAMRAHPFDSGAPTALLHKAAAAVLHKAADAALSLSPEGQILAIGGRIWPERADPGSQRLDPAGEGKPRC